MLRTLPGLPQKGMHVFASVIIVQMQISLRREVLQCIIASPSY